MSEIGFSARQQPIFDVACPFVGLKEVDGLYLKSVELQGFKSFAD